MKYIILLWIFSVILSQNSSIVNTCHCDLTPGFCDFNCCCDTNDCNPTTLSALKENGLKCETNPMSGYCLDKSYFAFINVQASSVDVQSDGTQCYYFNDNSIDQPEITLSDSMIQSIINEQTIQTTTSSTETFYTNGYDQTKTVFVINQTTNQDGQCIANRNGNYTTFYFGQDQVITCKRVNNSYPSNLLLYIWLQTTSIEQFKGENNLPNISFPTIYYDKDILSKLTVLIFYGKAGIQATPLNYIIDTRIIQEYSSNPDTFSLEIRFVDYNTLEETSDSLQLISAPFFPMIPSDIFYPLTYNGGKYLTLFVLGLLIFIF